MILYKNKQRAKIYIMCIFLLIFTMMSSSCGIKFPDFKSGIFTFNADELENEYNVNNNYVNDDIDENEYNENDDYTNAESEYGELKVNPNNNNITLTNMELEQYGYGVSLDKIKINDRGFGLGNTQVYITITNNGSGNINVDQSSCVIIQDKKQYNTKYELGDTLIQANIRPGVVSTGSIEFPLVNVSSMEVIILIYNDEYESMEFKFDLYIDPTDPNIYDDQSKEQVFTNAIVDYNGYIVSIEKVRYWPDSFWEGRFNMTIYLKVENNGPDILRINDAILYQNSNTYESVRTWDAPNQIEPNSTVSGTIQFDDVGFSDADIKIPAHLINTNYDSSESFLYNFELDLG